MKFLGRLAAYGDLIPIGLIIILTFCYSVDVPISDDWDLVPVLKHMHDGTLDWKTLDTSYAGHKMAVTYLLMGNIAILTHWNSDVFRCVNLFILIVAWMAIRPIAVREGRLLETAVFFWSFNQWVAWIWTWMIGPSLAVCCVLWALRLLTSKGYPNFLLAMVVAMLGTFSHGPALAVWPASFYILFFTPRPLLQRLAFAAILALAAYLYLQHPAPPSNVKPVGVYPLQMPFYLLQSLGAPLAFAAMGIAGIVSLGGLALLACVPWEKIKAQPFIVAVLIAGLSMMGMVMIARGGGGSLEQSTSSRYGTMAMLYWVAIVLLVDWTGWKRYALIALTTLCLIRSLTRFQDLANFKQLSLAESNALLQWSPDRLKFHGAQTTTAQLDEDEQLLREWHYSIFRNH
jgi:hypothetical protein